MMYIEARYEALRSDFVDSCCHRYVGKGTGRSPLDANRRAQGGAEIQQLSDTDGIAPKLSRRSKSLSVETRTKSRVAA